MFWSRQLQMRSSSTAGSTCDFRVKVVVYKNVVAFDVPVDDGRLCNMKKVQTLHALIFVIFVVASIQ